MGYYIQVPNNHDKTSQLVLLHGGEVIPQPWHFNEIPEDKGLIVVVDNGPFEAAGFAYNEAEFKAFTDLTDTRPKSFVLLDLALAKTLSGYG